jgi:hypothetical protein
MMALAGCSFACRVGAEMKNRIVAVIASSNVTLISPLVRMAHDTELSPIIVTANSIIDRVCLDGIFKHSAMAVTENQLHDQNAFDLALALHPIGFRLGLEISQNQCWHIVRHNGINTFTTR